MVLEFMLMTSGTSTFNNVLINATHGYAVYIGQATTQAIFNNCVITSSGIFTGYTIQFGAAGTITTNNCFIQGPTQLPHSLTQGTWNSNNDIINGFPYFNQTKEALTWIKANTNLVAARWNSLTGTLLQSSWSRVFSWSFFRSSDLYD